jgi:hypothetical protein
MIVLHFAAAAGLLTAVGQDHWVRTHDAALKTSVMFASNDVWRANRSLKFLMNLFNSVDILIS